MLDTTDFLESNDDDPELLIYIPFLSVVKIKSMIMIGGEDGLAPSHIKIFVNNDNPDFSLIDDGAPTQQFDCVQNPDGTLEYGLRPMKFSNVQSLSIIVDRNHGGDFSKIYYIGFTGIKTNKKKQILVGNFELKPVNDGNKLKEHEKMHGENLFG